MARWGVWGGAWEEEEGEEGRRGWEGGGEGGRRKRRMKRRDIVKQIYLPRSTHAFYMGSSCETLLMNVIDYINA